MKAILLEDSKDCQVMCKERQVKVGVGHWYWDRVVGWGMPWEVWETVPHLLWLPMTMGPEHLMGFKASLCILMKR